MRIIKPLVILLLAALLLLGGATSCDLGSVDRAAQEASGIIPLAEGEIAVHFLDVGQGDSIFAELPDGKTMLIDAAERDCGAGIADFIRDRGYERIDYLVVTHPHADHIGSMEFIVRRFEIGEVWLPNVAANTLMFERLMDAIREKQLTVREGRAGETVFSSGGCRAQVLAPAVIDEEELNNCSIVMRLDYGETSFLFTGDAQEEELGSIADDKVSADVLKVSHHGSVNGNPEDFLQRSAPQIAVISCGRNNDYGHPHRGTLERLEALRCRVYRTDCDGTVTVRSDGRKLSVTTGEKSIVRVRA